MLYWRKVHLTLLDLPFSWFRSSWSLILCELRIFDEELLNHYCSVYLDQLQHAALTAASDDQKYYIRSSQHWDEDEHGLQIIINTTSLLISTVSLYLLTASLSWVTLGSSGVWVVVREDGEWWHLPTSLAHWDTLDPGNTTEYIVMITQSHPLWFFCISMSTLSQTGS